MDPKADIFAAVRAAKADVFADPANIAALDALLDGFGIGKGVPTTGRRINAAGLQIVKESEGLRLKAYICPAGVLTIGYGSTGPHVKAGMVITEAQADDLLRDDLARFEDFVSAHCSPATDNQFAALVSFAFNLGNGALKDSTLRRKHMEGDYAGAASEFGKWVNAGGRQLPGLVKRRQREAQLYRSAS